MSEPKAFEESLIGWVNSIYKGDLKIENWDSDWTNGEAYVAIVRKYRADLIDDNFEKSKRNTTEEIFNIIEDNFHLPILVDPRDIAALDNFSFVAQLKQYFESKDFLIDKEIPNRSIPKSKSDIDLKRPLCSRLFARKSVQDKIEELKFENPRVQALDGIELNPNIEMEKPEDNIVEEEKISSASEGNPFGSDEEETNEDIQLKISDDENDRKEKLNQHSARVDEICKELKETELKETINEPDNGNPFGSDDDEEEVEKPNESTNPFGDDSDEDEPNGDITKDSADVGNSTNPFGSDDEDDDQKDSESPPGNPFGDFEEEDDDKNPFSAKTAPPKRPPPPKISPIKPTRKKKQAPPPPTDTPPVSGASRPKRPPPPKPKTKAAPGFGHPLIKRNVDNDEENLKLEMERVENEIIELEKNAAKLEDMLRFNSEDSNWKKDGDLMAEWMAIVKQRNELTRRDTELGYRLRLTRLEMKHAELEFEMRKILHKAPDTITDQEKAREKEIMEELVALVNKRDEMIETIELERQRVEKESESNNNSSALNTQSPAKVKKKTRVVSMKKIKSFVKKKDKKQKDISV